MSTLLISLLLAAAGAPAGDQPPAPAKPKKVCEKVEVTGSTVPKRVCRTVVEPVPPKDESRADSSKPATGAAS